jgi:hypothetical protein
LPLPRKVYIAGHLGLISLSPLMYYFTFMQATLIHLHNKTRSAILLLHNMQMQSPYRFAETCTIVLV